MTAAKVPDPQVKALQELSSIFPKSNKATWSSKKNLGNTWKMPSSGIPQVEMSPLPATHVGGLKSGAGLGDPKLTTESLGMGKCHLRLSWGTPSPFPGWGTLIHVPGDTEPCPGGH